MIQKPNSKKRFDFIDRFRGFIGVLMLLGHSSYYFNSVWLQLDPLDPLFPDWGQFMLRYVGYLCAPGFLMMNGAMVWWSFNRRIEKGDRAGVARWHLIQRGLFLVLVQITWVNSSWGGFTEFKPGHLGIISTIGISMVLLTLIIHFHWLVRTIIAIVILLAHALLLKLSYDPEILWQQVLMQTFIDSGSFNKYPVMPWFALGILGSVMANGWLKIWQTDKQRIIYGLIISLSVFALAVVIRLGRDFGNIFPFSDFGHYSFFIDQKYPPSLFMNLWAFAAVVLGVTFFIMLDRAFPKFLSLFSIPGKVPLFFYAVHLAILGVFVKRMDIFYREGGVMESLIGLLVMLVIMLPLCRWFFGVKRKSNNYLIKMI
jgi:uncharacterized membrane protein